jgi:electron transport complex protein RnfC
MLPTFSGGVYPRGKKKITENIDFSNLPIPQFCFIPIQQHQGTPAKPLVVARDIITEGQLIASAEGQISSNIHASIPGRVVEIKQSANIYEDQTVIVIEAGGSFGTSYSKKNNELWDNFSGKEILGKIEDAGIAGFSSTDSPASKKINQSADKKISLLIINGAESDPYLTSDDVLMKTFPAEIVEGIKIAMKALGVEKAVIGIENNKEKAIKAIQDEIQKANAGGSILLKEIKTKYPQGNEKLLIYSLTGSIVPSGLFPSDIGIAVHNVNTLFAVRNAVLYGKPMFERYVTVSGDMISKPGNYKVRIGTRISDIIEECGGLKGDPSRIVIGGSMCGQAVQSLDIPVVKSTTGILFMSEKEVNSDKATACIRCGRCVEVCPIGLLPCEISKAYEKNKFDKIERLNPSECILCGSCSYICPARRPLTPNIKMTQQKLKNS